MSKKHNISNRYKLTIKLARNPILENYFISIVIREITESHKQKHPRHNQPYYKTMSSNTFTALVKFSF